MLTERLRRRLATRGNDEGFVLIYVLMVVAVVTTLVGSVLVVSANTGLQKYSSSRGRGAIAQACRA